MKTELEKCLAGEWYDCHVPVFPELKRKTHCLLMKYNFLPYEGKETSFVVRDVRKYRYRGERSGMLLVEVMVVIFI